MNFWGLTPSIFTFIEEELVGFLEENMQNPKAEFYLPSVVDTLIASKRASVQVLPTRSPWFGITYREDKPRVVSGIRECVRKGLYPERLWS
jgi:hypothetical protein